MRKELAQASQKAQQHALKVAVVQRGTSSFGTSVISRASKIVASTGEGKLVIKAPGFGHGPAQRKGLWSKRERTKASNISKPSPRMIKVDVAQFVDDHRREIGRFGANALTKKVAQEYETAELVKLGCRPLKSPKMPIGLLQEKRKKEKERAAKQRELDFASGMLIRSKRR